MITLTFKQIANQGFMEATKCLWHCDVLHGGTAKQVHTLCKRAQTVLEKVRKDEIEIAKKHAKLDENGQFIRANMTPYSFDSVEKAKAFDAELEKYLDENTVEIKIQKLDFRAIQHVQGIPPSAFDALEPILVNLPAED